ncbi:hypothetical protein K449DRAFT_435685 [Hypoxylon sp. EC38]|nr:hypothetical protein K449DRAFT_435685 [Hypoxylon sp. EC38]
MSIDVRDISGANVKRLTRVLSRRPEYGIAIPSRRWLIRQEEKIKSLPGELLRSSNLFKRLAIKIVNSVDPSVIDPMAVLCKIHAALNPWLIRRFFLAVAYEVTVHTDTLRSWKDRMNYPILSAFVGRVDAIAALWTEPSLYRDCYGTPPFENHMVFVTSGCEACILAAMGANARVLADLRAILIDRVERRPPHRDGRSSKDPRLCRYVREWIDHLKPERAAKCRAMSDDVLSQLRVVRPQLKQWRNQRRRKDSNAQASNQPVYVELKNTRSGPRLSHVPVDASRKRRTKNGIPVAMADLESAEEQRRVAMYSMTQEANEGTRSIFRPDSITSNSRFGSPRFPAYDTANEQPPQVNDNVDPSVDYEDTEGDPELERDFAEEEESRKKVADWYTARLGETRADLTADDAKSVLSMVHPAFRPIDTFSHKSAAPAPLRLKKDRAPTSDRSNNSNARSSAWTDATVYTVDPSIANSGQRGVPPVPRIPSEYRREQRRRSEGGRPPSARPPRPRSSVPVDSTSRAGTRVTMSSSVYSDHPGFANNRSSRAPTIPARNPARNFLFAESDANSPISVGQRQYLRNHQGMRDFAPEDNPFARERTPRASTPRGNTSVPSMSSPRNTVNGTDNFEPPTPTSRDEDAWRESWGIPADDGRDSVGPDDSLTMAMWQMEDENAAEISPWSYFRRKP